MGPCNATAHHAGPQNCGTCGLPALTLGPDLATLDCLHAEEKGSDRGFAFGCGNQLAETAALNPQRLIKIHPHGVNGDIEYHLRGWQQTSGFTGQHGTAHGRNLTDSGSPCISTRVLKTLLIPGLCVSVRVGMNPGFGRRQQFICVGDYLVDQTSCQCPGRLKLCALSEQRRCSFQTNQCGQTYDSTRPR